MATLINLDVFCVYFGRKIELNLMLILLGILVRVQWVEEMRHRFLFLTICNWLDKRPKDLPI